MMIFLSIFFNLALTREISIFENYLLYVVAIIISASIFIFSRLFASETDEDEATVNNFFKQLSTPINVIEEVYSKGIKEVSTFPFIGKMAIFMGFLIGLLCFFGMNFHEITITLSLSLILIIVGSLLVYFGGRSEKKYVEKMEEVLRKAQL
jgi:hypothetical protein